MMGLGYSIDWRRQFTTNDPHYNQFIIWQYKSLHAWGLVVKGMHPVKYCTKDKNPVTTHDLLEGEGAEVMEFTLLKFAFGDDNTFIIAATFRPETMFGQTNMWVNPNVTYVKAEVSGENWIISRECAEKLGHQSKKIEIVGEISGKEMIGENCRAPVIDRDIIILPSEFPDPDIGTGLVTSVPSDAPYDLIALNDLKKDKDTCKKYGLDFEKIKGIEVIPIIHTEKYGDIAAEKAIAEYSIESQKDTEKLEAATKDVYATGFHEGSMLDSAGKYKGMAVIRVKEKVKEELLEEGRADTMYEFSEPVKCRCGGRVVVAEAESWFVDYANEDWKEKTRAAVEALNTIPENTKRDYLHTIDWLHAWPCIRNYGLGTKLPFDERFTIEPLSDSTIYMAYYTIAHLIKELKPEQLTHEFFNYVFKKEGDVKELAKQTKIPAEKIEDIRASFDYWYPQNWRCSALELIQNHLTFMLFHHTALFARDKWPKGIASFGMGLLEGSKMSSSKGNVIQVKQAVEKHGADTVRLFLMANAEPWQDFDWRENLVENTGKKLKVFYDTVVSAAQSKGSGKSAVDCWLTSRMQKTISEATEALEGFQTRKALQTAFYAVLGDISWYKRRGGQGNALKEAVSSWVGLMTPFTPYVCEELNSILGGEGFASNASYPKVDESKIDPVSEAGEELLKNILEDIQNIVSVTKAKPNKINLYLAPDWKRNVYEIIKKGGGVKEVMADSDLKKHGKDAAKLAQTRPEKIPETVLTLKQERDYLADAKDFLEKELGCGVVIQTDAKYDPQGKAKHALPAKPGLFIE